MAVCALLAGDLRVDMVLGFKNRMLWLGLALCGILLQIVKGLSLEPSTYPLSLTLMGYFDGAVRRGVFPTLYAALNLTTLEARAPVMVALHLCFLAALGLLLGWHVWKRLSEQNNRAGVLLVLLLIASPLLPVQAALTGYSDPFLILLLFAQAACLQRGRSICAAVLLFLAVLTHEMSLLLSLPLWIAQFWQPELRKRTGLVFGVALTAIIGFLVLTAVKQPELLPVLQARCTALRPAAHPLVFVWDQYCDVGLRGTISHYFLPFRLLMLPFYWMAYGFFPVALGLITYGLTRRHGLFAALPVWLALGIPYALVTIAWDVDRIILLGSVTGFLVLERTLRTYPITQPKPWLTGLVLLFITVQMMMTYPALKVYGAQRLVPPHRLDGILIDPETWIKPVFDNIKQNPPPFLDWRICIDLRC